ncbi:hypothetical protein F4801DRAFT_552855 [Xylaria longipes]|nr:hypothetical protein F4801DRAFT_552855 [Xylaria longipes]
MWFGRRVVYTIASVTVFLLIVSRVPGRSSADKAGDDLHRSKPKLKRTQALLCIIRCIEMYYLMQEVAILVAKGRGARDWNPANAGLTNLTD